MKKNILIINSLSGEKNGFLGFLEKIADEKYFFIIAASDPKSHLQCKNWQVKKICLGFKINEILSQTLFILTLPLLYMYCFIFLIYCRIVKKISVAICMNINEKIIFSPLARMLGVKIIWVEDSDSIMFKNSGANKLIVFLYRIFSKKAEIIVFSDYFKKRLIEIGVREKNIKLVPPGIKINQRERQNNIFQEMAQAERKNFRRKFFTIGAIAELNKKQGGEALFRAVKNCLTIIPNMQIIMVGDGEERKNLSWFAKKIGLDNIVWFVGEQACITKWLESFDCFIAIDKFSALNSLNLALNAQKAGLPIIGPKDSGLEKVLPEIFLENNCLIDLEDSETFARQLIRLWRDKILRRKLGEAGRKNVAANFAIDSAIKEINKIL